MNRDTAPREPGALSETEATTALWDDARACVDAFVALFGTAAVLVASLFIGRKDHAAANAFLRGLESLVRRILVIAASRLVPALPDFTPPPRRPPIRLPEPLPTTAHPVDLSERPQDKWPAMFRVMPRAAAEERAEPISYRPNGPHRKTNTPHGFRSTRSLALRLEAVRRVIDEPDFFIRAMAWGLKLRQAGAEAIVMQDDDLPDHAKPHLGYPLQHAAILALDAFTALDAPRRDTS